MHRAVQLQGILRVSDACSANAANQPTHTTAAAAPQRHPIGWARSCSVSRNYCAVPNLPALRYNAFSNTRAAKHVLDCVKGTSTPCVLSGINTIFPGPPPLPPKSVMEATQSTEAAAPAAPAQAPRENEATQPAPAVEPQAQASAQPAQPSDSAAEATSEAKQAPPPPKADAAPAAQAAQPKPAPVITRDRYNQQSCGASLNSRVKQVRWLRTLFKC